LTPGQLTGGAEFSLSGSSNTGSIGKLTITSGPAAGWSSMDLTGANVLSLRVHKGGQDTGALSGTWDASTQTFTVADIAETTSAAWANPNLMPVSWVIDMTVVDGNLDDVNAHFEMVSFMPPPSAPPPSPSPSHPPLQPPSPSPLPLPLWTITGSWSADAGSVSCTQDSALDGPDGHDPSRTCTNYRTPYLTPGQLTGGAEFSLSGSSNTGSIGKLTITSGPAAGWSSMDLTGANVLSLRVHKGGQDTGALSGTWDASTQTFTVADIAETTSAAWANPNLMPVSWVIDMTVVDGNLDDVNAHFEMVSFMPPPAPPPSTPSPAPSLPATTLLIDLSECGDECATICTPDQMAACDSATEANCFAPLQVQCDDTITEVKQRVRDAISQQCTQAAMGMMTQRSPPADTRLAFDTVPLTDGERSLDDYGICNDKTVISVLAPWEFTGSWSAPEATVICTVDQGPSECAVQAAATATPGLEGGTEFTVTGSTNYNGRGVLTILSGRHAGWSQVRFSAGPTGCRVKGAETEPGWDVIGDVNTWTAEERDANELSGSFDPSSQTWTVAPDDVDDTSAASPMYTPIPWNIDIELEDPECTGSVNAHFTILQFQPPPPSPSPAPYASPPPAVSVHGDPMFKSHGSGTHFWLAAGRLSPLLLWRSPEGASMRLSGKTFHSSDAKNQWFDQFVVTQDGVTVLDVAVKQNAIDARQLGNTIDIKVDGKSVDKRGASPKAVLLFQSAKAALKAKMSKRSDGFADNVETTAGGLSLAIYSSKADKFDTPKMAKKYMHLNIKFAGGLPKDASGIFTELAGNKPVSLATKALLKAPPGKLMPGKLASKPGKLASKPSKKTSVWKPPAMES